MAAFPFEMNRITDICRQNDVAMLGVFGSVARGEAVEHSDVDLLVKFDTSKGLLALVKLERELSDAIGKKVDLLTEASISPYLRDRILNEVQVIYEAG